MHHNQRTIAGPVECQGVGVHSGRAARMVIKPAPPNHGIKFVRTDLPGAPSIPALFKMVTDTSMATVLGRDGVIVSTVEHILACLAGLSIDNVVIELDSYEVPIMDGSALPFAEAITGAGIVEQEARRFFFMIKKPLVIEEGDRSVGVYPADSYRISYTIDYDHPLIGRQTLDFKVENGAFLEEICMARTFGFYHEYEYLKQHGLARGGSLENALVIEGDKVLNEGGLRRPDEFIRHKILDCIGDFSLLGMPLLGHVVAHKSGHMFNHRLLEALFNNKDCWETGQPKVRDLSGRPLAV